MKNEPRKLMLNQETLRKLSEDGTSPENQFFGTKTCSPTQCSPFSCHLAPC